MNSPLSPAILVVFCISILVSPALAKIPDPSNSHVDPVIVGNCTGDHIGNGFVVEVREMGNTPLAGVAITVDFTDSNSRPLLEQAANSLLTCPVLVQMSDISGRAVFYPRIVGFDNGTVVQVRGNGVLLRTIQSRSTDLNGDGNMDMIDLLIFSTNFLLAPESEETDFNLDSVTDGGDLVIFATDFLIAVPQAVCPQ